MTRRSEAGEDADTADVVAYARRLGLDTPVVERCTLSADAGALSALRWGEEPPRVVLLHGAGLHAGTWSRMLAEWGVPALAVDLPGHGQSDRLSVEGYRIQAMGEMLAQAMDRAGIAPAMMIGHSLGSFVAARAAQLSGGVGRFVVLDATPHRVGASDPTRMHAAPLATLVDAMHERMPHRDRASLEKAVLRHTRGRDDGLREWLWDGVFMDAVSLRALERDAIWESFARAADSTTLLRAERGGVTDAEASEFLERVPAASLVTVPGAGHNVQADQPRWLATWLRADLSR